MKRAIQLAVLATSFCYGQMDGLNANANGYTILTYAVPGTYDTAGAAINNAGQIAGTAYYSNPDGSESQRGYLRYPAGDVVNIIPPGATAAGALSISNTGTVSGYSITGKKNPVGFLYDGSYHEVQIGSSTYLHAVNIRGAVIVEGNRKTYLTAPDQPPYVFAAPGAEETTALGLNDFGQVVGTYYYPSGSSFVYTNGIYETIRFPDERINSLTATAINNRGVVVGQIRSQRHYYGFIFGNGEYRAFAIPGAVNTTLYGINDLGQVTGEYVQENGIQVPFIASLCNRDPRSRQSCGN